MRVQQHSPMQEGHDLMPPRPIPQACSASALNHLAVSSETGFRSSQPQRFIVISEESLIVLHGSLIKHEKWGAD